MGPGTAPAPEQMERFSTPMMVVGITATGLGVIGIFAGAFVLSESENNNDCLYYTDVSYGGCGTTDEDQATTGTVLLVVGGITAVLGIPLIVVGARKVPKTTPTDPTQPIVSLRPEVRIGSRSAALRWAF